MAVKELCPVQKFQKVMAQLWDFGMDPYTWEKPYRENPDKYEIDTTDVSRYILLRKKAKKIRNKNILFIWTPVAFALVFLSIEIYCLESFGSVDIGTGSTVTAAYLMILIGISVYFPRKRKVMMREQIAEILPLFDEGYREIKKYMMASSMVWPSICIAHIIWAFSLLIIANYS